MRYFLGTSLIVFGLFSIGCGSVSGPTPSAVTKTEAAPSADGAKLLLAEAPSASEDVIAARASAKDGDDVSIEGRIGGAVDPWVDGRAVFTIVDRTLIPCNERLGDNCKTPWDYCCDTDRLSKSIVTVKFVDEEGRTVPTDARKLLGVKELETVVVKGKAKRDDEGNLTVLATGLYVKPTEQARKAN